MRFRNSALMIILLAVAAFGYGQTIAQPATAAGNSHPTANPTPTSQAPVAENPVLAPSNAASTTNPDVEPRIGAGDLLKISVLGAPDYDQELRVGGNGTVALPLAGAVHIAGLTTEQAQQVIRQRLMDGGFFSDPQVSVLEKDLATQGVSVLGEVQKPGVYPVMGPRRLFDVLSLAGGTTPKAGPVISITHRNQPHQVEDVRLTRDPQKNLAANVEIFPGDTVVVSKAGIVYVVGDVHQPTGVVMENSGSITVLQAIAMAGGINSDAALNKSKIIRRTAQGPQEIPIQLKKILAAKSPDVKLEAEDIIFVPNSAAKNVASRTLDGAVRLATSIVAYRAVY